MRSCKIFGRLILGLAMLCVVATPALAAKDSITYADDNLTTLNKRFSKHSFYCTAIFFHNRRVLSDINQTSGQIT